MVTPGLNSRPPIVARIRALHDRLVKGQILASAGKVHPVVDMMDAYLVEGSKDTYLVQGGRCTCPDAGNRNGLTNGYCKHTLATLLYRQEVMPTKTTESTPNGPSPDNDQLESKIADLYR
jgi:uncharacterized Zn finger protein